MTQSCADIREAVRSGVVASDGATRAHLETCPACAALVAAGPLLRTWNDAEPEAALTPSFELVRTRLEEEAASPAGRLRERSTPLRVVLALVATALIVGPTLWMGGNGGGFAVYPVERTALFLVALSIALGVTITVALRPAYRPALAPGVARGIIAAAVLLELVLSALPDVPRADTAGRQSGALFALAMPCFYTGLLFGIPVYGVLRVLDHGVTRLAALLAACSAGLTANLALHLHCPITHPEHVLLGHFTVALAFLGAVASASSWMTRRRPAAPAAKDTLDKEIKTP